MTWGGWLMLHFGWGMLGGISLGDWLKLLNRNHFAVSPAFLIRAAVITFAAPWNSLFRWYESRRYGPELEKVSIRPPLFIIGHWRSGTTFLHNLFAVDDRFTYANLYQSGNPHTLLSTERFMAKCAPPTRSNRVVDEMRIGFDLPYEDEFAIAVACFKSPYVGLVFPRHAEQYDRFLTLQDVSPEELRDWRNAFTTFLRKLTLKHDRPIVLKSPCHTGRITALLDLFPQAKFIHIHRNPYDVFSSTRHLLTFLIRLHTLQRPDWRRLDDRILRQYREMYDAYLAQRGRIPEGHLREIAFEDLERDPMAEMRRAYEELDLPDFERIRPAVGAYLNSIASYRKNRHGTLPAALKDRIGREWGRFFEAWGYSTASVP